MKTEIVIEEELVVKEIARTGNQYLEMCLMINKGLDIDITDYVIEDMCNKNGEEIYLTEYLYSLVEIKFMHNLEFEIEYIDVETSSMLILVNGLSIYKLDLREHPFYITYHIFESIRNEYGDIKITK